MEAHRGLHGAPRYLRSDNGPEFVSHAILKWLQRAGIETALIDPAKPWQNGTAESLNGKLRDGCLCVEWFRNRLEAQAIIETWRRHYSGGMTSLVQADESIEHSLASR